jgi:D-glycero-D-manno-heptose 1,7-bisphosphate phosphatase
MSSEVNRPARRTTIWLPASSHSKIDPGPTPSLRRTSVGTEICPCDVIFEYAIATLSYYHGNVTIVSISGGTHTRLDGVHVQVREGAGTSAGSARPAVFLDRDGVIVEEVNYLHRIEDIRYIPGALEAIAKLNKAGLCVVVVTNQAGIGRGYYGWQDYEAVQDRIAADLARVGGWLDGVWACGYHPDGIGELRTDHSFRKPNPGMLTAAAERLGLSLGSSWMVGDKALDVEAASRAGLEGAVLVLTGYGAGMRDEVARMPKSATRIEEAADLAGAVDRILDILGV